MILKTEEVAKRLRLSKQTILRYEKKGIFPKPKRNKINQWREYTEEDVKKMEQILGRGVTIVELIMVMVIMGIILALAIPRFEAFYAVKLSGAVNKVISDIRYTQQLAISQHDTYRIIFYADQEKYEVRKVSDNSLAKEPFTRGDFAIDFKTDPQFKGIIIDQANFDGQNNLQFNWQGQPQVRMPDSSTPALSAEGQVTFSCQNNSLSVFVKPATGWIRAE